MTTTDHTAPAVRVSEHCAAGQPYDTRPATHTWCTGIGCVCRCHPRRLLRSQLNSYVFTHHVHVDIGAVLALADALLSDGFTPPVVGDLIRTALDAGWLPPVPT